MGVDSGFRRTVYCGDLSEAMVNNNVTVCGWVLTKRDMGGVIFLDVHDREGTLQAVFNSEKFSPEVFAEVEHIRNQSVVSVTGKVRLRDEETYNPKLKTGTVEVAADTITILSEADTLPFSPDDSESVKEEVRLKYRYLDLRSPRMINNLRFRYKIQRTAEEYLDNNGFIAVETPMLMKSTPEGARDYLVPSRVHPGCFYALPQSPQIFKQLLMVGGIDKYYQVARCFRDEDLRADRQPEFTQVDMEMSFVTQEDILVHLEKLFNYIFEKIMKRPIGKPFPRMTWNTAMDVYGSDKPDIRYGLPIVDISDIASQCGFSVFNAVTSSGGVVRAINVKGKSDFTRQQIEELTDFAGKNGAKGMAWIAVRPDGELYSVLTKYFSKEDMDALLARTNAKNGDFILFCADKLSTVRRVLGALRIHLAELLGLADKNRYEFLFVTDFPQFEYSEEEGRYMATHHPFTMPYEEDLQYLFSAPDRVRAQAYDVVLNGTELGSGSIRIHKSEVQRLMFKALGFGDEDIKRRFGFMVDAFRYGTPPHGGFAFGLDRFAMVLLGEGSLREVIAFPKTKDASCLMSGAPDFVDDEQLEVLKLISGTASENKTVKKEKKKAEVDIDRIAELSRLTLTDDEKTRFRKDLEDIIGFADVLSELDTGDIDASAHITGSVNVFRDDKVTNGNKRNEMLANAPTSDGVYFSVPKVVG